MTDAAYKLMDWRRCEALGLTHGALPSQSPSVFSSLACNSGEAAVVNQYEEQVCIWLRTNPGWTQCLFDGNGMQKGEQRTQQPLDLHEIWVLWAAVLDLIKGNFSYSRFDVFWIQQSLHLCKFPCLLLLSHREYTRTSASLLDFAAVKTCVRSSIVVYIVEPIVYLCCFEEQQFWESWLHKRTKLLGTGTESHIQYKCLL